VSDRFCVVGGYGHYVSFYWEEAERLKKLGLNVDPLPHHWVVRPECYEKAKLTDFESFVMKAQNIRFEISSQPDYEIWGN